MQTSGLLSKMAARGLNFLVRTLYFRVKTPVNRNVSTKKMWNRSTRTYSMPSFLGFMTSAAVVVENSSKSQKLEKVDPKNLTASYLLRNAAAANVDTAVTLFNQTVSTFLDVHEKYLDSIERLLKLQDLLVGSLGNEYQEQSVWDAMLVVRKEVNTYKAALTELEFVYSSTERLLNNSSEAAFITGAEYASSVGSERLHAAQFRINSAKDQTRKSDLAIAQKEAWVIQEMGNHAKEEKAEKKRKTEEGKEETSTKPDDKVVVNEVKLTSDDKTPVSNRADLNLPSRPIQEDNWFDIVLGKDNQNQNSFKEDNFTHEEFKEERKWESS